MFGSAGPQVADPPEAEEVEDGSEQGIEEAGLPGAAVLRSNGEITSDYSVGFFEFGIEIGECSEIIVVCFVNGKCLVAVPEEVWGRKLSERLLPQKALMKPLLMTVAAGEGVDEGEVVAKPPLKVWVGFLDPRFEEAVSFDVEVDPCHRFGKNGDRYPAAYALSGLANDHFGYVTAESGLPAPEEDPGEMRLKKLEEGFADIQKSLAVLVQSSKPTLINAAPKPEPKRKSALKKKGKEKEETVAGLDPQVVSSALSAGIPLEHLKEMGAIMKERPRRLDDLPRKTPAKKLTPLDEEEPELEEIEEEDEEDPEGGEGSGESGVEKAIVELTRIAAHLVDAKKKDPLEQLLDGGSGSAGSSEGTSLPQSKKNSAALRALQRCLKENPKHIYQVLEANLQSDFLSRPVAPGEAMAAGATVRGWLTAKSRIQLYVNHVRWVWQTAGVWDALIAGRTEEARARCALLVASAEQSSIDGGSWLLSSVSLLEQPPPFQMFSGHQAPASYECQHSMLFDPRWVEVFMGHVRELDSYQEARRKLGKGGKSREEKEDDAAARAKAKAKAKTGAKGKEGKGRSQQEDAGS